MLVISLVAGIQLGFVLDKIEKSKGLMDTFGGSLLMALIGGILYFPAVIIFTLIIGAPTTMVILRKGWNHLYTFLFVGAFSALLFLRIIPFLFSKGPSNFTDFVSGSIYFLLGGALTGFLLHRQLLKIV